MTESKGAIRLFKQQAAEFGMDPTRIITGGSGAGGHISALAGRSPDLDDPADPRDIDTKKPETDITGHMKVEIPPNAVFFGELDGYKKNGGAVESKWEAHGTSTIAWQIAPGQDHGFRSHFLAWKTVTPIARNRFRGTLGLLSGETDSRGSGQRRKTVSLHQTIQRAVMKSLIYRLLFLALVLPAGLSAAASDQKPNVVILLADDLRPDGLAALGNPIVKTPNLDKLVSSGFIFRRAYVHGAMTTGVCFPSRTMLLTGMSLFRSMNLTQDGKVGSGGTPNEFTFPRAMQAAGYATLHVGKKGLSPVAITNEFEETVDPGEAARVADVAVDFIRRQSGAKPMFLYIAGHEPHDPQYAPEEYYSHYKPEDMPLPKAFAPFHPFNNGAIKVRDEQTLPWPRTKEWISRKLARYCASTEYWDTEMGRVLDALRQAGQFDNTVFIVAADNGLSLGEHGLLGKQNVYEFGGMHVPLVFAGKGIPVGETRAIAYLMDIFPTVCDMTGTHQPSRADGLSLARVIRGEKARVREFGYNAYTGTQRAVSDDRWKLIRYPSIDKTQLFDILTDPHEEHDLVAFPEHTERVKALMAKLAELQKQYDDPHPLVRGNYLPAQWTPAELNAKDLENQAKQTAQTFQTPGYLGGEKSKKKPAK